MCYDTTMTLSLSADVPREFNRRLVISLAAFLSTQPSGPPALGHMDARDKRAGPPSGFSYNSAIPIWYEMLTICTLYAIPMDELGFVVRELKDNGEIDDRWNPRTKASDFDAFFDLRPKKKRLSKQSWGWWFETPSHPLLRHCNASCYD